MHYRKPHENKIYTSQRQDKSVFTYQARHESWLTLRLVGKTRAHEWTLI